MKILSGFILASLLSISILATESEVTYLVNQGPYISEYARVCDTAVVLNDVAQTRCANRGNGWHFGTIPTKASLDGAWNATKYLSTSIDNVWYASSDAATEGTWLHSAGRVTGKLFWIGVASGTCYTWYFDTFDGPVGVKYCPWDPAQPENYGNGLSTGADCAVFWGSAASTTTSKFVTGDTYCNRADIKCYLCERSRCNYTVDCFRPNTLNMVGDYWPNCTCICKPGAYGSKCQYPLVVDHGPYVSEYNFTCQATNILSAAAQAKCQGIGREWSLATFPSAGSLTKVWKQMYSPVYDVNYWIGISDAATEGTWLWSTGRAKGGHFWTGLANGVCETWALNSFYADYPNYFCPWASTQPENTYGSNDADCGVMWWGDDTHGTYEIGDTYCLRTDIKCYACERSPCQLGVDCYPPNTIALNGDYYPNCTCTCKPGTYGSKCQLPIIVNNGPYVSEYNRSCEALPFYSATAQSRCKAMGPEWNLATFPTSESFAVLWNHTRALDVQSRSEMWNGISDAASEGTWLWNTGRLAGKHFWTGLIAGTCHTWYLSTFEGNYANYFCPWGSIQPENTYGSNDADCGVVYATSSPTRSDVWASPGPYDMADTYCLRADIPCYACERSPCQLGLDCFRPNTINMTGQYYPYCNCTCKPGTNGTRCELPIIVDNGPFVSEYTRTCDASPLISSAAQTKCRLLGPEWNLATFPTPQSYSIFGQQTVYGDRFGDTAWSGSNDSALEGTWVWSHGRLAGKNFWTGLANGVCKTYWYGPAWANTSFKFCQFNETQPDNYSPSTAPGGAQCGGVWHNGTALVMGDTWCTRSTDIYCYACERSACNINVDCMPDNTASVAGYFPSCNCTCKFGASGSMCENVTTTTTTTSTTTTSTTTTSTTIAATTSTTTVVPSTPSAPTSTSTSAPVTPTTVGSTTEPPSISQTSSAGPTDTASHSWSTTTTESAPFTSVTTTSSIDTLPTSGETATSYPTTSSSAQTTFQTLGTSSTDASQPSQSQDTQTTLSSHTTVPGSSTSAVSVPSLPSTSPTQSASQTSDGTTGALTSLTTSPHLTTTVAEQSTNTSTTPGATTIPTSTQPEPYNAPATDDALNSALRLAASPEAAAIVASYSKTCKRLEDILALSGLLTPLPAVLKGGVGGADADDVRGTYNDVLLVNFVIFLGSLVLGGLSVGSFICYKVVLHSEKVTGYTTRSEFVKYCAASVRFPATALQCFTFLSHGTAVAAGLMLGEAGRDGTTPAGGAIAAAVIIFFAPVLWCVLVKFVCPLPRKVESAKPPGTTSEGVLELLCGAVRPTVQSKQLGPLVGDLCTQRILSPAIPALLPIVLFIVSLLMTIFEACDHVPLALGIVFLCYALVVLVTRPFLGYSHIAVEFMASALVGACLVAWQSEYQDGSASLTTGEDWYILVVIGVSSCRYPFVLARALDVVLPPVVSVRRSKGQAQHVADTEVPLVVDL